MGESKSDLLAYYSSSSRNYNLQITTPANFSGVKAVQLE